MYASCRGGYIGFKSTYIEYSYCTYDIPCYLMGKKTWFSRFCNLSGFFFISATKKGCTK